MTCILLLRDVLVICKYLGSVNSLDNESFTSAGLLLPLCTAVKGKLIIFQRVANCWYFYLACSCNLEHAEGCEEGSGRCFCKQNFQGEHCERCADGFYGYPFCVCKYASKIASFSVF